MASQSKPQDLTQADILAIKRLTYQESFLEFFKAGWHVLHPSTPLKMNWHIEAIADHLQAQSENQIQRLIINVPPGSCKSLLAGVYWPSWEWTFRPTLQTIATAASEDLALRDNQKAKWLIQSDWYQSLFPMELKQDSAGNSKFTNEQLGFRAAVPFTNITGHRGDRVIIDDAISASNADSDTLREKVNRTYFTSITTRLNEPKRSTITIIQQRLHQEDLVGAILEQDSRFETLILPMEYVPTTRVTSIGFTDPRSDPGELMFEDHWGQEEIDAFKAEGTYKYAAQFQQDPVPTEDGFFSVKAFQRYTEEQKPKNLHHYITSDHSLGMTDKSDFNVVRVWGLDEHKNIWLLDSYHKRSKLKEAMGIQSDETGKLTVANEGALAFVRKYQPLCWFAEPDNNFKGIRALVEDTMRATSTYCRIEYAANHNHSKQAKASAYQSMAQLGKVYLPVGPVGDAALLEYAAFPVGKHDDQVDADAILPRMISTAHAAVVVPAKGERPDRGEYAVLNDEGEEPGNWNMFF